MLMYQIPGMDSTPKKKTKTHWFCYNSNYYKGMKTGDEGDEIEQKKTREIMAKYMANYRAHRKGITPDEMSDYYSKWAENMQYDRDLEPGVYNGPTILSDEMCHCFHDRREKLRIIDIACGTGRVGKELVQCGFKSIDGVDPSAGMLKQCRKTNIYTNLYKEYCCDKKLPIEDSVYDCVLVAGGMGEGHIPCSGLNEMIRIVKPDARSLPYDISDECLLLAVVAFYWDAWYPVRVDINGLDLSAGCKELMPGQFGKLLVFLWAIINDLLSS